MKHRGRLSRWRCGHLRQRAARARARQVWSGVLKGVLDGLAHRLAPAIAAIPRKKEHFAATSLVWMFGSLTARTRPRAWT